MPFPKKRLPLVDNMSANVLLSQRKTMQPSHGEDRDWTSAISRPVKKSNVEKDERAGNRQI